MEYYDHEESNWRLYNYENILKWQWKNTYGEHINKKQRTIRI